MARARTGSVVLAALLLAAAPARAAFPGRNGVIAYETAKSAAGILYLQAAHGSRLRRLRANGPIGHAVFSPLGRRIAFAQLGTLWVMYADGSSLRAVTDGRLPASQPAWSPDGARLAFAGGPPGARSIWVVGADGNGLQRLTTGATDDRSPAWSSKGRIALVRKTRRGGDEIYVIAAPGARARRVTHTPQDEESPAWSPDGRRIAYASGARGARTIHVMRAGGGLDRQLTRPAVDAASPAWSPDGRFISFTARATRRRQLYVMHADGSAPRRLTRSATDVASPDWQPIGSDPVIAAAGDIACDPATVAFDGGLGTATECHELQTSDILMTMDLSAVLVLGDAQYEDGRAGAWPPSFDPTWGRLKSLLHPVVGNHEYRTAGAAGYYDYFDGPGRPDGPAGPRATGDYSFHIGAWHVIALNSQCSEAPGRRAGVDCSAGSPQERWLRADLAAHPAACTLAFWHHPLRSSGIGRENPAMLPIWQALYDGGADVVLNGHDHTYERFAPQDPTGARDPVRGIRTFVVGTGGRGLQPISNLMPYTEAIQDTTFGVLELTLHPRSYSWRFVSEAGATFSDAGANACH